MRYKTSIPLALACCATIATSQTKLPEPVVGTVQPYSYASKTVTNSTRDLLLVDQHVVRRTGASFLQIEFGTVVLSEESILEIEGLRDRETQVFEFDTWDPNVPHSAYFNGDAVRIRLWAGRGATQDRFMIRSLGVGNEAISSPQTICGSADDRTPSSDARVARLIVRRGTNIGVCTGWLISSNRGFATAGTLLRAAAVADHCRVQRAAFVRSREDDPSPSDRPVQLESQVRLPGRWRGG